MAEPGVPGAFSRARNPRGIPFSAERDPLKQSLDEVNAPTRCVNARRRAHGARPTVDQPPTVPPTIIELMSGGAHERLEARRSLALPFPRRRFRAEDLPVAAAEPDAATLARRETAG
jgi:hypothetical protein